MIQSYRDLEVWKKSIKLVKDVYCITKSFTAEELYTLTSQTRRAAISVPSNIAEGHARNSSREYIRFLNIAYASLAELETHIIIAQELSYIAHNNTESLLEKTAEIGRMTNGLIRALEKRIISDPRPLTPAPSKKEEAA